LADPRGGIVAHDAARLAAVGCGVSADAALEVQEATGDAVEIAFVEQSYTGDAPAQVAAELGIHLEVVKLPEAKKGFILLPRRWVVERSFSWLARFRRLARDYERLADTLAGLHFLAFALILLRRVGALLALSP
jgi:transposase